MSEESQDWMTRLDPRRLGLLGPAALVGGAGTGTPSGLADQAGDPASGVAPPGKILPGIVFWPLRSPPRDARCEFDPSRAHRLKSAPEPVADSKGFVANPLGSSRRPKARQDPPNGESRMADPRYPSLYQVNTRVRLTEWSLRLGRPSTLADLPDEELDRIAELGVDWVWFLSVWQTGAAGRRLSRSNPEWRKEFHETLPDLVDDDIPGSGFRRQRLQNPHGARRRRSPGRAAEASSEARPQADAGFRPQPHGAGPSVGRRASRLFRRGLRAGPGPQPEELRPRSRPAPATGSSPMAATPSSRAGPTLCSSTTAAGRRGKRWPESC